MEHFTKILNGCTHSTENTLKKYEKSLEPPRNLVILSQMDLMSSLGLVFPAEMLLY